MSLIYEPKGKAREYSPYALNIYLSCTHRCKYCYAPRCRRQTEEEYFKKPHPRRGIAENLRKELRRGNVPKEQVLLSFIGDVYCETHDDNQATRECLEILLEHHVPVAILTKGGNRCLRDLDIFKKFGEHIQIGTTLTFHDKKDSAEWESGAALPEERLDVLRILHDEGIKTFASFEPVIKPEQSLALMEAGLDCIDTYKVGKLNNYKGLDKAINWTKFLVNTLEILRGKKNLYIKQDLRKAAPGVFLLEDEIVPDKYNVEWR